MVLAYIPSHVFDVCLFVLVCVVLHVYYSFVLGHEHSCLRGQTMHSEVGGG